MAPSTFYFDLASPLAYIAAERAMHELSGPVDWVPVLARELPGPDPLEGFRCREEHDVFRANVERRAAAIGLQPLRWPADFPFASALAMRAATYARSIGRAIPFALAAFRQAFAGGHSLADVDHVLIAAAACEMHPAAILQSVERQSIADRLAAATATAARAGVREVPAVLPAGTGAR
jgi:2-hydroxychromene-2-carboxylate isomerase